MKLIILILCLFSGAALAQPQQQPDPAYLQKVLAAVQFQRNQALDNEAVLRAQLDTVSAELAKAKARIEELEAKVPK